MEIRTQSLELIAPLGKFIQKLNAEFPGMERHIKTIYLNCIGVCQIIHEADWESEFVILDCIEYLEAIASEIDEIREIHILDCLVGVSDS